MKCLRYLILAIALLLSSILSSCSSTQNNKSIIIASKLFTENILLSEMYAQLIETYTELEVIRKQHLGPTAICFAALENAEIDIYVEYTGTIYTELLGYENISDISADELYAQIKKEMDETKGITLFNTIGLNNTYALAMLRAKADTMGIETMSELSPAAPRLVFAANSLYYARANDGYDTMRQKYGLSFKSAVKMNNALLFDAAADDQVDVIVVYATDSLLPKYDMILLRDDKQLFPDYYALPMIRNEVLKKYPELQDVLNLLSDSIDNERMQMLNYLIDIENVSPEDAARTFLEELGLVNAH